MGAILNRIHINNTIKEMLKLYSDDIVGKDVIYYDKVVGKVIEFDKITREVTIKFNKKDYFEVKKSCQI